MRGMSQQTDVRMALLLNTASAWVHPVQADWLAYTWQTPHRILDAAGDWQLKGGLDLQWSDGDQWTAEIELPAGQIIEYKYALLDGSGTISLDWQQGNNSVLALRRDDREVGNVHHHHAVCISAAILLSCHSNQATEHQDWPVALQP